MFFSINQNQLNEIYNKDVAVSKLTIEKENIASYKENVIMIPSN